MLVSNSTHFIQFKLLNIKININFKVQLICVFIKLIFLVGDSPRVNCTHERHFIGLPKLEGPADVDQEAVSL